tara:strand:+ start:1962 stop:2066 length:105 start_codon:yes stop_codon:yes gene_type:complete
MAQETFFLFSFQKGMMIVVTMELTIALWAMPQRM